MLRKGFHDVAVKSELKIHKISDLSLWDGCCSCGHAPDAISVPVAWTEHLRKRKDLGFKNTQVLL